jgi:uncharacterized protein YxjI
MRYHLRKRFSVKHDSVVLKESDPNNRDASIWDVRGSFLRIGDHFRVYDRNTRQEIFSIQQKILTVYEKQYIIYQGKTQIATIQKNKQPDFSSQTPFVAQSSVPVFLEIFCANGVVLQLRGDFMRNNFEMLDQFARIYGNTRREFAFLRHRYTIDIVDTTYALIAVATTVVLDRLWKYPDQKRKK